MANLPEPARHRDLVLHPSLVKAAVSPAAVAVTAAGAGIGVLDHSVVLAVVLAVVGWAGRMTAAVVSKRRREQAARPRPARLDPWSVPEPWRQLVQQAGTAQTRFDRAVRDLPEGPLKEHLDALRPRFYTEVDAVGAIARRGAAMSGWTGVAGAATTAGSGELGSELAQTQAERNRVAPTSPGRAAALARTEEALAAQLRSRRAAEQAAEDVLDRLRVMVARLDDTVTTVLQLGTDIAPPGSADTVAANLGALREEVLALQAGLDEARTPPEPLKP